MWQYSKTIQKTINYDNGTKENIKRHNLNWPQIPDHSYSILVIGDSRSGKTNVLLNLIKQEDDNDYSSIDKTNLYAKDPYEAKYQYLIKKRENNDLKNLEDWKAFIEYSSNMEDISKNIENTSQPRNVIAFDYMIADMTRNKKLSPILSEVFIRGRKLRVC